MATLGDTHYSRSGDTSREGEKNEEVQEHNGDAIIREPISRVAVPKQDIFVSLKRASARFAGARRR